MRGHEHHTSHRDFNSIKVRLEHSAGRPDTSQVPNFNSIKVRLELTAERSARPRTLISIP